MLSLSRLPLRYLLLGVLLGFAALTGVGTYRVLTSTILEQVERQEIAALRAELTHLQGVLQMLLRTGDFAGIRTVVASYGSLPEHELALVTNADGLILAATRLALIDMPLAAFDVHLHETLLTQGTTASGMVIQRAMHGQKLSGYVPVCGVLNGDALRPTRCGLLYTSTNLSIQKSTALRALRHQALLHGAGLTLAAAMLWGLIHVRVTRRVEHLITTAQHFTTGNLTARTGLQGNDELARVGQAFDTMAQAIADNQQHLEKTNRQLAERLFALRQTEEALLRARDELELRVEERTAELHEANAEALRFAYIVSHDLRAPLINLQGFAGELRLACNALTVTLPLLQSHVSDTQRDHVRQAIEQDIPEALDFIDASVARMDTLIHALLQLSRLGRLELHFEAVEMESVVRDTLQTLAHQIARRQVQVTVGSLPVVQADRTAMAQIMGNLLANAIAYLVPERPGRITITGERLATATAFHVHDNGRGIAMEDIPRVFEPFRRVGRPDVPGEGMGLAYVRTLVRRHGGEISCHSVLGEETTFTFTIAHERNA